MLIDKLLFWPHPALWLACWGNSDREFFAIFKYGRWFWKIKIKLKNLRIKNFVGLLNDMNNIKLIRLTHIDNLDACTIRFASDLFIVLYSLPTYHSIESLWAVEYLDDLFHFIPIGCSQDMTRQTHTWWLFLLIWAQLCSVFCTRNPRWQQTAACFFAFYPPNHKGRMTYGKKPLILINSCTYICWNRSINYVRVDLC